MRAVIQRVTSASVTVDGTVISQISRGLMVLVGIGTDDTASDASLLINKILNLRVFNDPTDSEKMWKANVKDIDGEILCVSQFTLLAQTTKGNKPDFHRAMPAETSQVMYEAFLNQLRQGYKPDKVQDGKFGAMMNVSLTNEGPVTFTLDSRKFEYIEPSGVEAGTKRKPSKTSGS
ncbi:D-Tyr tRNAtyr deacylase-like domain-containing protein [Lentinula raphanica]|uniref:D-aminoacyl-tRNA deacylase n=1 Tax=Lentinula raphanica TaxID=153919 RepID=A0AA38PG16_9AGAR|nr:D-tyrosyl-tRNA deacylase [Lentinula raphanica]KAJ3776799.1 D-Tyr tRNAtyr deacylase-like domain-containing protein [Lentinula raphanica]KAJ3842243.1 D-Tyr tRNAtyr deacylase-like domain-containing protein [Lentinula raphanica]KAJ3973330.1 D-Tyr tRNAtyr deacylase-like domain-containing protein [Lentinula raphanica]